MVARLSIPAVGFSSVVSIPDFPEMRNFRGPMYTQCSGRRRRRQRQKGGIGWDRAQRRANYLVRGKAGRISYGILAESVSYVLEIQIPAKAGRVIRAGPLEFLRGGV